MKLQKKLGLVFIFAMVLYSCNTQKNTFINRNVNTMKARYNVLYNGQLAFDEGLEELSSKHKDNFWKRLEIEPITFDETEIVAPKFNSPGGGFDSKEGEAESKSSTPFDRAEEKAVKSIQKYSMNIDGYEKNSQTDNAYLLLGKSRYYTQRFTPAIEAYNYILVNYPKADLHYETRVWRAKANVRLGNEETAIETMNLLLKVLDEKEEVSKRVKEEAYTAMAIAYAETDTIQKVIENLNLATETFINKEQSARNMFVLGQIYSELNRKDSARMVFQKLADKRQAPDKFRIHANIELAKNAEGDSSSIALIDRFKKLIRNSDNRDYLDELYYQIGTLEEKRDSTNKAVNFYKKSLAETKGGGNYQKTYTYERLGNINFDQQNYILAGSYYDSVLKLSTEKFDEEKRIRRIRRKNKGLTILRKHEELVKNNDSILQIVAMSSDERTIYFENYIEKLKKEDEERKQQLLNAQNFGSQFEGNTIGGNKKAGKWYFYSSESKSFGKTAFTNTWGNRPLEDNWRWSDKTTTASEEVVEEIDDSKKYEVSTYLEMVPTDEKEITKLKEGRNEALYQLGLIYKEQFKNEDLAIKNLELLKVSNTNVNLNLPINYHLYQLYTNNGDTVNADAAKNYIFQNHPDSKYATIIKSPNKKLDVTTSEEDENLKKYKELYYLYKDEKHSQVVSGVESFQQNVNNSELIPKLALLKALAIGKYKSKDEYKKELEYVAFTYANKEEGKKAQEIIKLLDKPQEKP